jgi:hypothetical protein
MAWLEKIVGIGHSFLARPGLAPTLVPLTATLLARSPMLLLVGLLLPGV